MKKWLALLCVSALLAAAPGCVSKQAERQQDFVPGEPVSTYWFQFTLDGVDWVDSYDGYRPAADSRLVVCRISIENTFDDAISMTQTDFFLLWEDEDHPADSSAELEGMAGSYALPQFSNRQMEDSYDLAREELREGDLVFEVPREVERCALVFEEYYVDSESETGYSIGDRYQVWFDLTEA